MSYKVVRNGAGDVVCYGPNDNNYGPVVATGNTLFVEATFPSASLAQLRAEKLAQLEQARKQAIDNLPPVTVAGKQYPANPDCRSLINSHVRKQAAGKPIPGNLRDAGGVAVTLNAALLGQVDDAMEAAVQAQWDKYWTKFDAVNAPDATAASIAAVVW